MIAFSFVSDEEGLARIFSSSCLINTFYLFYPILIKLNYRIRIWSIYLKLIIWFIQIEFFAIFLFLCRIYVGLCVFHHHFFLLLLFGCKQCWWWCLNICIRIFFLIWFVSSWTELDSFFWLHTEHTHWWNCMHTIFFGKILLFWE